jgi:hypothetical protein
MSHRTEETRKSQEKPTFDQDLNPEYLEYKLHALPLSKTALSSAYLCKVKVKLPLCL